MNKIFKFIVVIVIAKILLFAWELTLGQLNHVNGFWGFTGGDWLTYLKPIDYLLSNGSYAPDQRMPGYGVALLLPRFFVDRTSSLNVVIILQMLTGIVSTIALGEIAYKSFNRRLSFYYTILLYTICISVSIFDAYIASESFSISFAIISVWLLFLFKEKNKKYLLLLSGFFVAWSIFIRPVMIVLLVAQAFYLLAIYFKKDKAKALGSTLILVSVFAVFDAAWIIRNYTVHHEFRPLTSKDLYIADENQKSQNIKPFVFQFMEAWGGDIVYWNPSAEIRWFGFKETRFNNLHLADNANDKSLEPPAYIYTSKFNRDSLLAIKALTQQILWADLPEDKKEEYSTIVSNKLIEYTNSIKTEKPLVYYVYGPLKVMRKLLFKTGTSIMFSKSFSNLPWYEKGIKLFESVLNIAIMLLGFLGIAVALVKRDFIKVFIPAIFIVLNIAFLCLIFRSSEERFLMPLYPFLLVCSAYLLPVTNWEKRLDGRVE